MKTYAIAAGLTIVFVAAIALTYTIVTSINQRPIMIGTNSKPPIINEADRPVLGAATKENEELTNKINYWKKVVAEHPDYRDGYMQLASLTYEMNNLVAAIDYVNKTLELDPNHPPAKELKNILSSGN